MHYETSPTKRNTTVFAENPLRKVADPDVVMQYPLHGRCEGPEVIKAMVDRLRAAFPDLRFWIVGDVIAEGDYVVGHWEVCDLIDTVPGKVILVGHSKNGFLISHVAEYRPEKIEKLVYLAAVLAKDGKSAGDCFKLDKEEVLGPYITNHPEINR